MLPVRPTRVLSWMVPILVLWPCMIRAQDEDGGTPFRLHVTTHLFQIPTLVLKPNFETYPPLQARQFIVKIQGQRPLTPRAARLEGEDPISLAILWDARDPRERLTDNAAENVTALISGSLHDQDRLQLFAFGCKLMRHVGSQYPTEGNVEGAVHDLLVSPGLHGTSPGKTACDKPLHLLDAVARVSQTMDHLPGRRVLLVFTNGEDSRGELDAPAVAHIANHDGVAVFGIYNAGLTSQIAQGHSSFLTLCQMSGGVALWAAPKDEQATLKRFVNMLRERYILEFQWPGGMMTGQHYIAVEIRSSPPALVLSAGTSALMDVPPPDTVEHESNPIR